MRVEELLAKQAICEGLYRYCRSLDRMDRALYATVFQPAAALDYGEDFAGTAEEFCEWVWAAHATMQAHSPQITNTLVDVDAAGGAAGGGGPGPRGAARKARTRGGAACPPRR